MTVSNPSAWADPVLWRVTLGGTLRLATPIAFAALGEMTAERSGTLNLGIDGMMTAGAFVAIVGSSLGGWPLGLAFAASAGLLLGLGMAAATLVGRMNQIVAGIALSLISAGLTAYAFQLWQPSGQLMPEAPVAPIVTIPYLAKVSPLADALLSQNVLTYAFVGILLAIVIALRWTRIGILLAAVGDDPEVAALRGVNAKAVRAFALAFAGVMAALGGAAITVGFLGSYSDGVTAGRGYVAIAVVIIGRWSPVGATLGALLFAFFDSLSLRVQGRLMDWPNEVFAMAPYLMTLVVLILTARANVAPRKLGELIEPN